jgi:hypothetical protein
LYIFKSCENRRDLQGLGGKKSTHFVDVGNHLEEKEFGGK